MTDPQPVERDCANIVVVPLPSTWLAILERDVPFYADLRDDERARFDEKLTMLVRTKSFSAAAGFAIDERVKVVVSAVAARLTMSIAFEELSRLTYVIMHAGTFENDDGEGLHGGGELRVRCTAVVGRGAAGPRRAR